jgi:hypothetical protein
MMQAILSLNYLAVLVVTIAGFLLGWLWYSPLLFVKPWMAEMKFTAEAMKAAAAKGMARYFAMGLACALVSTFGLAVLIRAHGSPGWLKGAEFGLFVGVCVVGARLFNGGIWENRSLRLQAINLGHEVALFVLPGAILGVWR